MIQAGFAGLGSAAGVVTIYPTDSTYQGASKAEFINGVKVYGTGGGLTAAFTGLKAIEYLLDATYSDITGVCERHNTRVGAAALRERASNTV